MAIKKIGKMMKRLYVQLRRLLWYNENRDKTYIKKTTEGYVCYTREGWKKVYLYNETVSYKYIYPLRSISRGIKISKRYLQADTVSLKRRRGKIVIKKI